MTIFFKRDFDPIFQKSSFSKLIFLIICCSAHCPPPTHNFRDPSIQENNAKVPSIPRNNSVSSHNAGGRDSSTSQLRILQDPNPRRFSLVTNNDNANVSSRHDPLRPGLTLLTGQSYSRPNEKTNSVAPQRTNNPELRELILSRGKTPAPSMHRDARSPSVNAPDRGVSMFRDERSPSVAAPDYVGDSNFRGLTPSAVPNRDPSMFPEDRIERIEQLLEDRSQNFPHRKIDFSQQFGDRSPNSSSPQSSLERNRQLIAEKDAIVQDLREQMERLQANNFSKEASASMEAATVNNNQSWEAKLKELEAQHAAVLGLKDADIEELRKQLAQLSKENEKIAAIEGKLAALESAKLALEDELQDLKEKSPCRSRLRELGLQLQAIEQRTQIFATMQDKFFTFCKDPSQRATMFGKKLIDDEAFLQDVEALLSHYPQARLKFQNLPELRLMFQHFNQIVQSTVDLLMRTKLVNASNARQSRLIMLSQCVGHSMHPAFEKAYKSAMKCVLESTNAELDQALLAKEGLSTRSAYINAILKKVQVDVTSNKLDESGKKEAAALIAAIKQILDEKK